MPCCCISLHARAADMRLTDATTVGSFFHAAQSHRRLRCGAAVRPALPPPPRHPQDQGLGLFWPRPDFLCPCCSSVLGPEQRQVAQAGRRACSPRSCVTPTQRPSACDARPQALMRPRAAAALSAARPSAQPHHHPSPTLSLSLCLSISESDGAPSPRR